MSDVFLPVGTPLDYLTELIWNESMLCDRFFAWANPQLLDQVRRAAEYKSFEPAPGALHKGATCSYKQIQFGEANLQLTFHENDRKQIGNTNCIMVEPDIDYYKDTAAHLIMEVAVNHLTGGLTDPKEVYALRWIAGMQGTIAPFEPPYTIEA